MPSKKSTGNSYEAADSQLTPNEMTRFNFTFKPVTKSTENILPCTSSPNLEKHDWAANVDKLFEGHDEASIFREF